MSGRWVEWLRAEGEGKGTNQPLHFPWLSKRIPLELELFQEGLKPSLKLEDLTPDEGERLKAELQQRGNRVELVGQEGAPAPFERDMGDAALPPVTLFASPIGTLLEELVASERQERTSGSSRLQAILRSGELLGYPRCCVEAFAARPRQDDGEVVKALLSAGDPEERHPALLNFFPPMTSPVSWYPCSLHCGAALEVAERWLKGLASSDPLARHHRLDVLAGSTLVFGRFLFIHLPLAVKDGASVRFDGVTDALSFTGEKRLVESPVLQQFREEVTEQFPKAGSLLLKGDSLVVMSDSGGPLEGRILQEVSLLHFA